jgi:hypothetical protein
MKIIISEQQLKRVIKEFQDIYDDGIDRLTQEIEKEVKASGFDMSPDGVMDYSWPIKREKESKRLLTLIKEKVVKFLIDYFKLEKSNIIDRINKYVNKSFELTTHHDIVFNYATYLIHVPDRYFIVKVRTGKYDLDKNDFKKTINHLIEWVKGLLSPKQKKELDVTVADVKTRFAPSYSGEKLTDELEKRIYDWEYTKTILEKIISEYINNPQYIKKELYDKIMDENVINIMMERMDKVMEKNDYNVFTSIKQDNWRKDFSNFLKSYTTYYKQTFKGNEEQFYQDMKVDKKLPTEILFGRMLWDMTYWINK